jgi:hypothetical protein
MIYSCCDSGTLDQGCIIIDDHDFLPTDTSLVQKYQEYMEYAATPQCIGSALTGSKIRKAVVLHCELAGLQAPGEQKDELTHFSVDDYLTGETLINSPVLPSNMTNWRTQYKGFSVVTMAQAIRNGTALYGAMGARSKLWQFIDSDTILIGHALKKDLHFLKIVHTKIVDSAILVENAMGSSRGLPPSFHGLYKRFLGNNLQNNKRKRDTCLEDLMAKREIVFWCVKNPLQLAWWGRVMEEEERRKDEERERKKLATTAHAMLRRSHTSEKKTLKTIAEDENLAKQMEGSLNESEELCGQASERRVTRLSDGEPENTGTESQGRQDEEGIHSSKKLSNQDLEYIGTRIKETLEEDASPRHKRLKLAPMINDNEAKDHDLLGRESLKNHTTV